MQEAFVSLVPLRAGSKGIKRKNLVDINGSPLCSYVINASIASGLKTYVSTEDLEIKKRCLSINQKINIIDRPADLAYDESSTEDVIEHFLQVEKKSKHIILLQATSPLTSSNNINAAINKYIEHQYRPLVSVVKKHSFIWDKNGVPVNYDPFKRPRRQDWQGIYIENGAIYIFSREHFNKNKCRASNHCTLFTMDNKSSVEIDDQYDLDIINCLISKNSYVLRLLLQSNLHETLLHSRGL